MLQQRQNILHNRAESVGKIEETQQKSDRLLNQLVVSSQNPRITLSLHQTPELSTSIGTLNPVSSSQSLSSNSLQNQPVSEENSQIQQNDETTGQNSQRQRFSSISQFNQNLNKPIIEQQENDIKQESTNELLNLDTKSNRPSHFHSSQHSKKINSKGPATLMPLQKQNNLAFHCLNKITEKSSKNGIISLNHPLSLPRTSKEKEHSNEQKNSNFAGKEDKFMFQKYNIAVRNAGNVQQSNLGPKISSDFQKSNKRIRDALMNKLLAMKNEGIAEDKKSLQNKVPKIIIDKSSDDRNTHEERLLVKVNNKRMQFGNVSEESGKISGSNSQHKRASVSTQSSIAKQQIDLTDEKLYYFTRAQRQRSDHILSRSSQIMSSKQGSQLLSSQNDCGNERQHKNNKAASNIARIAGNSSAEEGNIPNKDNLSSNVTSNLQLKQRLFGQSVNFSLKSSFMEDSRSSQHTSHQHLQRTRQKLHSSNAIGFQSSQTDAQSVQDRVKKRSSLGQIENITQDDNFSLMNQSNRRTQKQLLSRTNEAPFTYWCSSLEKKLNLSLDKNAGKEQIQELSLPKQDKLQSHSVDTKIINDIDGQHSQEKEEEPNEDKFKDISQHLINNEYTKEEEFKQIQKNKQHKYLPLTIKKVIEQPYFQTMKIISNGLLHRDPQGPLITATEQDIVSLFQRLLEAQQAVTANNADPFRKILSSPNEIAKRIENKLNEITTAILAIDKAKNGDTKLSRVANHFFDAFSYLKFILFSTETSYLNNSIASSLNNLINSNNSRQLPLLTYLNPTQLRLRLYHNNFSKFFLPQDFLVLLEYVIFSDLDGIRMKAEGFLHRLIQNRLAGMSENMESTVKKIFDIEQEYLFAKQAPHRMKEIFSIKTPSYDKAGSNSHAPEIYENLKKIQKKSSHDKSDSLFQVNSLMDALTNNLSRNLKKYQISSPYSADIDPIIKKEIVEMYNTTHKYQYN